jgi:hypothetical protein
MHDLRADHVLEALTLVASLGQTIAWIKDTQGNAGLQLSSIQVQEFRNRVAQLIVELNASEMRLAALSAKRVLDSFNSMEFVFPNVQIQPATLVVIHQQLNDLSTRLRDEFVSRKVVVLPLDKDEFYKPEKPLFGDAVSLKFPIISEDIAEAGNCIAFGRYTASVFHLMRALESVVQQLGDKLGATIVDKHGIDLDWGIIIANMKGPVEAMPKGIDKDKWSESLTLLVHVKQAWRHPTMHPKQTYTEEEAKDIFSATRSFMRSLAALI